MTPDEIAESLEVASLTHQLAVSAAYEELRTLPRDDPRAKMLRHSLNVSYGRFAAMPREYSETAHSVVVPLPVKPRTSWTVLKSLAGKHVHCSSGFSPGGAWSWIVETVAEEHGCGIDQVGNLEGTEDQYDGDDLVTIDGLPVYRIEHTVSPFEK